MHLRYLTALLVLLLNSDFDFAIGRNTSHALRNIKQRVAVEAVEVRQGHVLGYISSGDYFGESSLIATAADDPNFRYDRTVTAMTDCELCYLQRSDIPQLMSKFPALERQLQGFVDMRLRSEQSRRMFNEVDEDHSGHLSSPEVLQLLTNLGVAGESDRAAAAQAMDIEGGEHVGSKREQLCLVTV